MKIDADEVRSTLNNLIETCKDSDEGFRAAAEKLKDASVKTDFLKVARQRATFSGELQAEVTRMGSEPSKSGSTTAALHRGWLGSSARRHRRQRSRHSGRGGTW